MANENNKSDYTKPFMDLRKFLPEPYQSDTNISLFNNLFNRYLTKQEIDKVSGYIGQGNSSAIISRQIKEISNHRQGFQLQPMLYNKIGSIEHMASWQDLQNEMGRLGVDIEDFVNWGSTQKFNWVPPVDINKIINYKDYYWSDPQRSLPQYITVRSRCSVATSRTTFWESIINQYGSTFPIDEIIETDNILSFQTYSIENIETGTGTVSVTGDATEDLLNGDFFNIINTTSNNGIYQITSEPAYSGSTNTTNITVDGLTSNEVVGTVTLRRFDKIALSSNYEEVDVLSGSPEVLTTETSGILTGDYTKLFESGFVFFLRNLNNDELNNTYVEVVSSEFDDENSRTIITITLSVTDDTFAGGEGSLEEQQSIYVAERNCQCGILGGWDDGSLWDDNPSLPLWGDTEDAAGNPSPDGISDHQNLLDRISNPTPPTTPGAQNELWYDTAGNRLYQYDTVSGWNVAWNNFDLILNLTTGFALWDQTPACDTSPRIEAVDQWITQNKWQHKNDISNYASLRRATQPIIEYDWDLELNEWTYVDYRWAYRKEIDDTFEETDESPPSIEIEPITWWELEDAADVNNKTITLDLRYGDMTDWFSSDKQMYISDGTTITVYEVDYSEYKSQPSDFPYRTFVTLKVKPSSTGNLDNQQPNTYRIYPLSTEQGDLWQGYGTHWLFLGVEDALPVPHQNSNPYIPIEQGTIGIPVFDGASPTEVIYEYRTSLYSQSYLVQATAGYSVFELLDELPVVTTPIDTRTLRRKALYGFDDIRVYTTNIIGGDVVRQFGNYDEIGEVVLNIIGIDFSTNEFLVDGDYTSYFNIGDTVRLCGNTGIGASDFVISSLSPTNANRIRVEAPSSPNNIPTNTSVDGEISNVTQPISSEGFSNSQNVTIYTIGIEFFTPIGAGNNIVIEIAAASVNELGNSYKKVRMEEDNEQYIIVGDVSVSQIQYRKVEQIKTHANQYPLFDIFNVDGTPAFRANSIFGYKTSAEYDINSSTGLRIVYDDVNNIYEFDQFLLDEDNGDLFAYRDYANKQEDYWYNPETRVLRFWAGTQWADKTEMSEHYRRAVVSAVEPSIRERDINGLYWYNITSNKLYKRFINDDTFIGSWNEITTFDVFVTDINLQTIWKGGLNDELYVPDKVDWNRRSEVEYNIEMQTYVDARTAELLIEDPSMLESDAIAQATSEWKMDQSNHISSNGDWIGDWEIPDPLYFNHLHENRKYLNTRELLTHFSTIIEQQPKIPGFTGAKSGMFNLIPTHSVNYGFGGTIKEFNNGFDTLLSSTFVNNVTPRSLIDYAHDQYEGLLNSIKEIYRENAIDLLTNVEVNNILDLSSYVAAEVIETHELNDRASLIYGDSTTFTDVDGTNDLGVRNWIATLPYVNLVNATPPDRIIDESLSVNEVVHHDGHRKEYILTPASADIISQLIVAKSDPRTSSDTIGKSSSNLPPNNVTEFENNFDGQITNREGVYWYHIPISGTKILYRYVVAKSGTTTPSSSYPDGSLWVDLNTAQEVLRTKNTDLQGIVTWDVVTGLIIGDGKLHNGTDPADLTTATISAWQEVDLNVILNDIIFELESKLYDNVPTFSSLDLAYDFDALTTENPSKYQTYLEEAFLNYISQAGISTPYLNSEYSSSDAFTWNYLRSSNGGGINILEADGLTNSFLVSGNKVSLFDPCHASADIGSPLFSQCVPAGSDFTFYVKNSGVNDGTWKTILSKQTAFATEYNSMDNTTRIFVDGDVIDSFTGIIYSGVLPSLKSSLQPNNLNDGSESGGDWRDLYTKVYGTPYPHVEPWVLQGYTNKPDWWDTEYRNDDVEQWGDRTWKYKHGFDVVEVDNNNTDSIDGTHGIFAIQGNFHTNFISGEGFTVDDSVTHAGTYSIGNHDDIIMVNSGIAGTASIVIADFPPDPAVAIYLPGMIFAISAPGMGPTINTIFKSYTIRSVTHILNDFTIVVDEEITTVDATIIDDGAHFINGTLYNPITNLTEIKIPTLVANNIPSGRIPQPFGMWENIRIGQIPPGRSYPNGVVGITGQPNEDTLNGLSIPDLPTFNYFSVNINNTTVSADGGTTTYKPDGVFPPYWDHTVVFTSPTVTIDNVVRSLYYDFSTEIISPNANYVFGDSGTVEWEWRVSSQFLYDQLTVAFRIDPMRFIFSTFGFNLTEIGGLQVDRDKKNTPSHNRVNFHGEIVNNEQFKSNGLNQWYVNYNRYVGYDANFSDFRELWTGWTAPLTYQFATFVDTPSLSIGHRYVNITNFDYNISAKRAPGVDDFWLDALKVGIINIPHNIARYDNQLDWRFELKTNIPISRDIKYYDIHNYQFSADDVTDICSLYTWEIKSINTFDKTFTIAGDQVYVFTTGSQFDILNSAGNNGTYDVVNASYDSIADITTITINNVILSAVTDGTLKANYRKLPWNTGEGIYLSTAEALPIPLLGDTINGLTKYFIIVLSDTTFKLAETQIDAEMNIAIDVTAAGSKDQFVGEVLSTFLVDAGTRTTTNWRYYALDKTNILGINTPHEVQGMQTLVNVIHGYDAYLDDAGWKINEDKSLQDPDSSRIVSWQVEMERFITYAYSQRSVREQINDRYSVVVDDSTNIWTFISVNKTFITGDSIIISSSNEVYPSPLSRGIRYYIIRDTIDTFRLAASKQEAQDGIVIDILSTVGVGDLSLSLPRALGTLVQEFEINPFRNATWFNPPRGIVSNIITGPAEDIRTTQLVFNQNGDRINIDQLHVYRQDNQTKISVTNATEGDTMPLVSSEYSLLHLGGLHLFIDAYEHVMILNNYTSEENLLYDPFIGLNVTKYEMLFNRQPEFTQRPNVGGYYLETFFNQGANIKENIEAGVENLRNAYDTHNTLETNLMTEYSRKALGYEGTEEYLSNLNLSQKSQFLFWRGQIQSKGSINAVNAFINSRRFIDAKIDDFWAIKIGSFGSVGEKEFPEMNITTVDARSNELRLEFIENSADDSTVEETFTAIKMSDDVRWYNQPDQVSILRNNGKIMYFDMKVKNKYPAGGSPVVIINNNLKTYIQHNLDVDVVEVTEFLPLTNETITLQDGTDYRIVNNNIIEFIQAVGSPATSADNIIIWGFVYNNDAQSPARIIDRKSETQVSPIQFWDPARGIHYSNALHNIDLQNVSDPAHYDDDNSPQTTSYESVWKESFIGTSWLNTENLDYIPYFSKEAFPDTTERFRNWGQLAGWSGIEIYEWVESDIPPSEWDAIAATEEGDRTIVEHLRKAGTARKVLFEKDGANWIPVVNKFDEQYAATNGTDNLDGTFTFDVDVSDFTQSGSPLQYFVNIYVNGKLSVENSVLAISGSPMTYNTIVTAKEADVVRFVQLIPADQEVIDVLLAGSPETHRQEYEYTQVPFYDDLGNIYYKYYFWVGNKGTKPTGKNRTMSIQETEIQLASIPAAHMFFQEPKAASDPDDPSSQVIVEDITIDRSEVTIADGATQDIPVGLTVADGTTILVEVNGVELLDTQLSYIGGSPNIVSILIPLFVGDVIRVTYTGVDNKPINLPVRFTQAIIRGLQGIVNADNRYTIRYTRKFTLRDRLDVEDENVGNIDLKALHEEWKIFRQHQQFNIDRWQWDKITEAIIGHTLSDSNIRVPSYERELYDDKYGSDTQYGLGDDQTFVNGALALNTITAYLDNPDYDFIPIDINIFFEVNNFSTTENIVAAMDDIYNSFPYEHVNGMYFSVLKDAFTTKAKYPDIFKTSMVSLHGIRPFQSSGIFDD